MPDKLPCELVSWHRFYQLCRILARRIMQSDFRPEIIVAVGRGGYMPGRVLSDMLGLMDLTTFRIEHYRGAQKQYHALIRYPLNADLQGKRVLLMDDVSDSGETFQLAIEHVHQAGPPAELRTAVLDHKTVSAYQPDFFARRIVKWRWITYPWAVTEDVKVFLYDIEPRPTTAEALIGYLKQNYGISLSLRQAEHILEMISAQEVWSGKINKAAKLKKQF